MEQRPKALAIYQAVLALLDEGVDINSMKVSQVAALAGIGKGTVYDYFPSKEEMVVCAVLYEVQRMMKEICTQVEQTTTFKEKIYRVFSYLEENVGESQSLGRFMRLVDHTFGMGCSMRVLMERKKEEVCSLPNALDDLYQEAKKEGLVEEVPISVAGATMLTKFMTYLMHLAQKEDLSGINREWLKEFLYQGILADLNVSVRLA